jgi:hypothetical protein
MGRMVGFAEDDMDELYVGFLDGTLTHF